MKRTVIRMLNEAVEKYGNAPYVLDKKDTGYEPMGYKELSQKAGYFASSLFDMGFEKNNTIAVLAEGRISWVLTEFGILKAACISVPLSIKLLPEEILFRLNHSGAKAIIASRNTIEKIIEIIDKVNESDFKIIYLEDNIDDIKQKLDNKGLILNKNLLILSDLISNGKESFGENQMSLQKIEEDINENDVVTICYTSGTTGNPKGIMLTHLNYYSNSRDAMEYFNVKEYYRLMIILPLDHSFAHTVGIYASLVRGLAIFFVDARGGGMATIKNIPINLKEANPHFMLTVPALSGNFMNKISDGIAAKGGFAKTLFDSGMKAGMAMFGDGYHKGGFFAKIANIVQYKIADKLVFSKVRKIFGDNLQYCVGGGALLDIKQQRFFYSLGIPIYQGYGLTEATPIISANTPQVHKLGSSGKVLPSVEAKIMKSDSTEAPVGVKGELVIRGDNVMKGYFKNESATNETIRDGWLYTGDLGYFDADGFLIITGREKALLISQDGEKYSPEEIEEAIINCSDLAAQAMIHNDHNKITVAIITLNKSHTENLIKEKGIKDASALLDEVKKSLYKFKSESDYIDKFPEKWIPAQFTIVAEPFSEQNHMINSTLKMVRYKIKETYNHFLDDMNKTDGASITKERNIKTLKEVFF